MSLKTLLLLNSIDGIQNYDPILIIYYCFNTNILIYIQISNIREKLLISLKMPFFNNIKNANSSNTLTSGFRYNNPIVCHSVNNKDVV